MQKLCEIAKSLLLLN